MVALAEPAATMVENQDQIKAKQEKQRKKKEKKKLKKLMEKQKLEEEESQKKKQEEEEKQKAMDVQENETKKKKKKSKKRKLDDQEQQDMKKPKVEEVEEEAKVEEEASESPKKKKKKNKKNKEKKEQENQETVAVVEEKEPEEPEAKPAKKKKKKEKSAPYVATESLFKKCFYTPTAHTNSLPESTITAFTEEHSANISGAGADDYRPILEFKDTNLDPLCLTACKDFQKPTPIQSLCWPIVASGRDIVGIAETGSGKTLAFSVPALAHMIHRKKNKHPEGVSRSPMMLVLAPTRELAMQSQVVLEQAGKACGIRSACMYGGVSKYEQKHHLKSGVEVIVATPGRLLDLMNEGFCDLSGVSYLVLDEADRMLDQGFERDIRAILSQTHAERQTCLFSATWPDSIRELAQDFLKNPIKVTIGSEDLAAGKKVTQIVEVVEDRSREFRLQKLLENYHKNNNRILVFVLYKKEADRILNGLTRKGWNACAIHGDRSQEQRIKAVEDFKKGTVPILVATDVAARGLDIPGVEYVINFSFPLTIEDYVHRIGRTGRAGKSGIAHTFFHMGDKLRAGELVKVLKDSNQNVPKEMMSFDLSIKKKEHKLYGRFGPKDDGKPMKTATKITFD